MAGYVTATGDYSNSNIYTAQMTIPTTAQAGDLLLAWACCNYYGNLTSSTMPGGWTFIAGDSGSGPYHSACWYRIATASDPGSTVTLQFQGGYVNTVGFAMAVYRGYSGVDVSSGSAGSLTAGSVTTTRSNDLLAWLYAAATNSPGDYLAYTGPSNGTTRFTVGPPTSNTGSALLLADAIQASPGATPTATASLTASGSGGYAGADAFTIALELAYQAPPAPSLISPPNASYADVTSGFTPTADLYSSDGQNLSGYALRAKDGSGAYSYWDASTSAWSSSLLFNSANVAPGGQISVAIPNGGVIANGNTINWSYAAQGAGGSSYEGPFASDFTLTAESVPTVSLNVPSSTEQSPLISWVPHPGSGTSQTAYQIWIESGSYGSNPGQGTTVWNSGVVSSSATSVTTGTALVNRTSYRVFCQITETGGITSSWVYQDITVHLDVPATPSIVSATATTDPSTGCPVVEIVVQANDNFLTADDASFESSLGTWVAGANTTIARSSAKSEDGSYSQSLTATSAGTVSSQTVAGTSGYAVTAGTEYTAVASFLAATTGRSCTVGIMWYDSSGSFITASDSGDVTDSTTGWTQNHRTASAPAGAVYAAVYVEVLGGSASEVHYVDEVGLFLGTNTTWSSGGFVGSTLVSVQRSDGEWVRYASNTNGEAVPVGTQLVTAYDYEVPTYESFTYTAYVTLSAPVLTSAASAASGAVKIETTAWWEIDPLNPSSAVSAQMAEWTPVNTEQSTAHMVTNMPTMNVIANAMLNQDFSAKAKTFDPNTYEGFQALLVGQQTVWISSPYGAIDCGWFRIGPESGGMSSGFGTKAKSTSLQPSTASAPYREVDITAIAQPRPPDLGSSG